MQEKFADKDVVVAGVTAADAEAVGAFRLKHMADYPVLASAKSDLESFGIVKIPAVRLIDPQGNIVASDLAAAAEVLAAQLDS